VHLRLWPGPEEPGRGRGKMHSGDRDLDRNPTGVRRGSDRCASKQTDRADALIPSGRPGF
jgi:hypothetical protein